jgi:hypothetical protein
MYRIEQRLKQATLRDALSEMRVSCRRRLLPLNGRGYPHKRALLPSPSCGLRCHTRRGTDRIASMPDGMVRPSVQLVLHTTRHAIPTIFAWREFCFRRRPHELRNEPGDLPFAELALICGTTRCGNAHALIVCLLGTDRAAERDALAKLNSLSRGHP